MTVSIALIDGSLWCSVHSRNVHFAVAIQILTEEIRHGVLRRPQHAVGRRGEGTVGFAEVHGENAELIFACHQVLPAVAVVIGKAEGRGIDHAVRR
jgi:hypothetical protein